MHLVQPPASTPCAGASEMIGRWVAVLLLQSPSTPVTLCTDAPLAATSADKGFAWAGASSRTCVPLGEPVPAEGDVYKAGLPHSAASSPANPFPPKQTSTRQDIEGMNLCSFALQVAFAPCSLSGSQLLISGRLAVTTGVFVPKSSSPGGTPVVPRRDLTIGLASSATFELKLPQWPSWPGWACMVILILM